jgi:regulator of PEP synthase PpsR (kinase-PPPase family)
MASRFIDVLSDSTGETAERVIRAALLQFPQAEVTIRRHTRVRTKERVEPLLRQIAADRSLLVFSVVSPELSGYIHKLTAELGIEAIDVIGGVIGKLQTFFEHLPIHRPGPLLPLSAEYFRRIEAVGFTVRSDAGREPRSLLRADLILIGVARTSKTPLATLLAQRGVKVASVTINPESPLPAELADARQDRIVALTIDAGSLSAIREAELQKLGMPGDTRVRAHVEREVRHAEGVFANHPSWPIIDITGRSVEETAAIVLELMSGPLSS